MPLSAHVNGNLWAIAADGSVFFTSSSTPAWQCITLPSSGTTLASSEALDLLFIACEDGTLHAVQASTGALVRSSPSPLHSRPLCLVIVASEQALFAGLSDGSVVRVHLPSLAFDCMLGCGIEHSAAVHALAVDNHYLYSAGDDAVVLVWDLKDLTTVRDFSVSSVPIRSLLRVDFVLWLGLHNGCVQVIEIFGDDLNGVTNVSAKRPHNSPVVDLVQVGQTQVWSLEQQADIANLREDSLSNIDDNNPSQPPIAPSTVSSRSNVAVWDIHDFTYRLSDEVDNLFVKSLAIVRSDPFQRVTIAALSPDLSAQLVISDVFANRDTSSSPTNNQPSSSQQLDAQAFKRQQAYIKDLEQQLTTVSEKLRLTDMNDPSATGLDDDLVVRQEQPHPLDDVVANSSMIVGDVDEVVTATAPAVNVPVTVPVPVTGDPFVMPASVTDAIQTSLSRLADVLASLLTEDVLGGDFSSMPRKQQSASTATAIGTPVRRRKSSKYGASSSTTVTGTVSSAMNLQQSQHQKEHVRNTVAALTKELNMARQLVACCVSGEDGNSRTAQLLKTMREISTSPNPLISITSSSSLNDMQGSEVEISKAGVIRDLKKRVDELIGRAERAESDARTVRNERDLLRDEVSHEREQAERTLSSLEGLLRERTNTIEARDSEIEELRLACDDFEAKLKDERFLRKGTEDKRDELKRINRKLADRCKSVEAELNEATAAVELARKDLALKEDNLRKHIAKRECELDHLNISLAAATRDCEELRQERRRRANLSSPDDDDDDNANDHACALSSSTNSQLQTPQSLAVPQVATNSKAQNGLQVSTAPSSKQGAQQSHPHPALETPGPHPTLLANEDKGKDERSSNENDENVNAVNEDEADGQVSLLKKELEKAHIRIAQLETDKRKFERAASVSEQPETPSLERTDSLKNDDNAQLSPVKSLRESSHPTVSNQRPPAWSTATNSKKHMSTSGREMKTSSKNGDCNVKNRKGEINSHEQLQDGCSGETEKNANDLDNLQQECAELKRRLGEEAGVIEELKQTVTRYVNVEEVVGDCQLGQQKTEQGPSQNNRIGAERSESNADPRNEEEETSLNINMIKLELSRLHDEVDLLQSEVEHRQAAASLYEEEAENMKCVISDLRLATNELQASLERSDEETRQLYTTLEEMRATIRVRDMRISALEGHITALSCARENVTLTENAENDENFDTVSKEVSTNECDKNGGEQQQHFSTDEEDDNMRARALEALLASANGEIEHMTREMESLYHAQVARDKELHSVYDGLQLRDERIRKRDAVIEQLKAKVLEWQRRWHLQMNGQVSVNMGPSTGLPNGNGNEGASLSVPNGSVGTTMGVEKEQKRDGLVCRDIALLDTPTSLSVTKSADSSPASSLSVVPEDMVKGMLQELSEGVIVTKQRMQDVSRVAKEFKLLAQKHTAMLPMLHEFEQNLGRISSSASSTSLTVQQHKNENKRNKSNEFMSVLATIRGLIQCIIAHYYTMPQKRACLGMSLATHAVYQPCDHRMATLMHSLRQYALC